MTPCETVEPMLLTVAQVASMLQIARSKAYEMVAQGEIPSVRLGRSVRVPRAALAAWVTSSTKTKRVV
ncbi:helix-turn-helix domain-containing protein [Symbiobacterium terraclitae]|uniref:helix-turn-helix domain-containing protein n=1 Tax=Symbiobacterium terraclitae TaxID=557451 RepID=UPI0035B5144C